MTYPFTLLLVLLSFMSKGQISSFRECFIYSGELRRINHPDKLFIEKTLSRSQQNVPVGATEILVWNVSKRDTQWIAFSQKIKNGNLLWLRNLKRIEINGLMLKGKAKNILIAYAIKKCK